MRIIGCSAVPVPDKTFSVFNSHSTSFAGYEFHNESFRFFPGFKATFRTLELAMKAFEKNLILLRGIPGSGKSTLAGVLSENGQYPVHSVDAFFTNPESGEYVFEFDKNHLAYKDCVAKTENSMQNSISKILVDNTFIFEWEIAPYLELATKYGYSVFVTTVEKYHGNSNIHGITTDQIERMAARYKLKLF